MKIKGTRIPYRLVDGYVEEYGEEFKKELLNDYPYISQEQLDNYLINLYEQIKRYREALEFYAEQDNYEWETSLRPQQEIDCMVIDDGGHTARKALEGEEK